MFCHEKLRTHPSRLMLTETCFILKILYILVK